VRKSENDNWSGVMKIATYNVWNNDINIRTEQLVKEINGLDADIVGLQEVPPSFWKELIAQVAYKYNIYFTYENEDEGLAFLSKHPFNEPFFLNESREFENSMALNIIIEINKIKYSITNVHLPWDSVLAKEKQIVSIDKYIHNQKNKVDFFVLLGDFNCTENSSIHHYLLGDQSLYGFEAKPYWNDIGKAYTVLNGLNNMPTLDFVNNPRWGGKNTNYIPDTCDRILIMESYNWDSVFKIINVNTFGKTVSPETGFAPSDHYGLVANVEFIK
jgi:endonuclease/exonuclease/phosphatase family metal-dependent hydrolase